MPKSSEFREISDGCEMTSFHLIKISPFKLTLNHVHVNYMSFKQNESVSSLVKGRLELDGLQGPFQL